jgi:hypothetical protein
MKTILSALLIACALAPPPAGATAQVADVLVLDGEKVPLHTNPLQPYLDANPESVPKFSPGSTANWRGYVATFAIRNGMLIVDRVEVSRWEKAAGREESVRRVEDVVTRVFGGRDDVPATWYTGVLVIPRGRLVNYVHMGYGSTYERYTVIRVQSGHVLQRLDMTAEEFDAYRKARFEAFRKTPEYRAKAAALSSRRDGMDEASIEDFLYHFESEHYLSRD